jgi:hypothetical protein
LIKGFLVTANSSANSPTVIPCLAPRVLKIHWTLAA